MPFLCVLEVTQERAVSVKNKENICYGTHPGIECSCSKLYKKSRGSHRSEQPRDLMRGTRILSRHMRRDDHADCRRYEVEQLVHVPSVLVNERPHVLIQLSKNTFNRLLVGRVRRQIYIMDFVCLHVLISLVVVDAPVVVQHDTRVRLQHAGETGNVGVHLRRKTLKK